MNRSKTLQLAWPWKKSQPSTWRVGKWCLRSHPSIRAANDGCRVGPSGLGWRPRFEFAEIRPTGRPAGLEAETTSISCRPAAGANSRSQLPLAHCRHLTLPVLIVVILFLLASASTGYLAGCQSHSRCRFQTLISGADFCHSISKEGFGTQDFRHTRTQKERREGCREPPNFVGFRCPTRWTYRRHPL